MVDIRAYDAGWLERFLFRWCACMTALDFSVDAIVDVARTGSSFDVILLPVSFVTTTAVIYGAWWFAHPQRSTDHAGDGRQARDDEGDDSGDKAGLA
jgi:hypothetical protein